MFRPISTRRLVNGKGFRVQDYGRFEKSRGYSRICSGCQPVSEVLVPAPGPHSTHSTQCNTAQRSAARLAIYRLESKHPSQGSTNVVWGILSRNQSRVKHNLISLRSRGPAEPMSLHAWVRYLLAAFTPDHVDGNVGWRELLTRFAAADSTRCCAEQ